MRPVCKAIRRTGGPCRGVPLHGSDLCPAHHPATQEARRAGSSKGGRAARRRDVDRCFGCPYADPHGAEMDRLLRDLEAKPATKPAPQDDADDLDRIIRELRHEIDAGTRLDRLKVGVDLPPELWGTIEDRDAELDALLRELGGDA